MKDFDFLTRGQSAPQGKPRVYFTCHPEDREQYFDTIGKELLDRQNCTVFFLDGDTRADEVEDYEIRLGEMQLFVVPVTTKLLTKPCRAMDVDVPFALSHHIPVLPLMQESGLDELFTKKFGDLQYLDKTDADPTAISYDEKLTKYLNAVIVGDELAKQVRAAFDAYIFRRVYFSQLPQKGSAVRTGADAPDPQQSHVPGHRDLVRRVPHPG